MKRGEIWWASLPPPTGSGPGFRRPVLVVQSSSFNDSRIASVIVAVITSNLAVEAAPGNVRLSKADSSLSKPSVVNISQLFTIDRALLTKRVRALPGQSMQQVESGFRLVLGL
jgi:mRNA interferase MazF